MTEPTRPPSEHLNTILLREAKLIVLAYEQYLKDKITSKDLAQKMLNLRDIIRRVENSGRQTNDK